VYKSREQLDLERREREHQRWKHEDDEARALKRSQRDAQRREREQMIDVNHLVQRVDDAVGREMRSWFDRLQSALDTVAPRSTSTSTSMTSRAVATPTEVPTKTSSHGRRPRSASTTRTQQHRRRSSSLKGTTQTTSRRRRSVHIHPTNNNENGRIENEQSPQYQLTSNHDNIDEEKANISPRHHHRRHREYPQRGHHRVHRHHHQRPNDQSTVDTVVSPELTHKLIELTERSRDMEQQIATLTRLRATHHDRHPLSSSTTKLDTKMAWPEWPRGDATHEHIYPPSAPMQETWPNPVIEPIVDHGWSYSNASQQHGSRRDNTPLGEHTTLSNLLTFARGLPHQY
jgi:hypothetical protein